MSRTRIPSELINTLVGPGVTDETSGVVSRNPVLEFQHPFIVTPDHARKKTIIGFDDSAVSLSTTSESESGLEQELIRIPRAKLISGTFGMNDFTLVVTEAATQVSNSRIVLSRATFHFTVAQHPIEVGRNPYGFSIYSIETEQFLEDLLVGATLYAMTVTTSRGAFHGGDINTIDTLTITVTVDESDVIISVPPINEELLTSRVVSTQCYIGSEFS